MIAISYTVYNMSADNYNIDIDRDRDRDSSTHNTNTINNKKFSSIRISQQCKAKLKSIGKLGDTYSDVIERLASQRLTYERIDNNQEVRISAREDMTATGGDLLNK